MPQPEKGPTEAAEPVVVDVREAALHPGHTQKSSWQFCPPGAAAVQHCALIDQPPPNR